MGSFYFEEEFMRNFITEYNTRVKIGKEKVNREEDTNVR